VLGEVCFTRNFEFELYFWFTTFSYHLLVLRVFLLLDDILELFIGFWSSSCALCGLGFEIETLCLCVVNVLVKGRLRNQVVLGLISDE
jgi:hypothetical protein